MLNALHVMGDYWRPNSDGMSKLGDTVASAKDLGAEGALHRLAGQLGDFAGTLDLPDECIVAPVPIASTRGAHPVPTLAVAVADAAGTTPTAVLRRGEGNVRLRDTPPERRREAVESAGYEVIIDVTDRAVVLVDDVILTGTTLTFLAELLVAAGAANVTAVVAARTRHADD